MAENKFPTEMVSLPSRGWFYDSKNPLASGEIEIKYMTAKEEDILTSANLIKKGIVFDTEAEEDYNVVHLHYGTNLLPNEIDLSWANQKRNNEYNFVGTIHAPRPDAPPIHQDFIEIVKRNNIPFNHRDPWVNPANEMENVDLMRKSIFVGDFRPAEQKAMRYTADRIMKAISYGCLVVSDAPYAKDFIDKDLLVSEDAQEIFDMGMENQYNIDLITHLMEVVKRDHTWVNRCRGLLKIVEEF